MASSNAPVTIQSITLVVNGLNKMIDFYRDVIGLNEISRDSSSAWAKPKSRYLVPAVGEKKRKGYSRCLVNIV